MEECEDEELPARKMRRGDTFVFDVQVFSPTDNCTPQDLTGWFMWFTAKFYVSDADNQAVTQRTSLPAGGIVFTFPTIGKAQVTVPPIATRSFPDGPVTLIYDVQVKDPFGSIFTVETGTLIVRPDATRAIA